MCVHHQYLIWHRVGPHTSRDAFVRLQSYNWVSLYSWFTQVYVTYSDVNSAYYLGKSVPQEVPVIIACSNKSF